MNVAESALADFTVDENDGLNHGPFPIWDWETLSLAYVELSGFATTLAVTWRFDPDPNNANDVQSTTQNFNINPNDGLNTILAVIGPYVMITSVTGQPTNQYHCSLWPGDFPYEKTIP